MEHYHRGERREQTKRLKNKRQNYWGKTTKTKDKKFLGKVVNTATICSCHMCGNARKHYGNSGLSLKELSDKEFLKTV